MHPEPNLNLDNTPIQVSLNKHIQSPKKKCLKALNLLKVFAHTDWGADRKVHLRLYRYHICSKLDYGSIAYVSARKSYLKCFDSIHNHGLRIVNGVFKTSLVKGLYVDANESSLYFGNKNLQVSAFETKIKPF